MARTRAVLELGDLTIDLHRGEVRGMETHRLGKTERKLLAYLMARTGQAVSRAELLDNVWGYSPQTRTRTVDVTFARLRQKLKRQGGLPPLLVTVYGEGYRFDAVPASVPVSEPSAGWVVSVQRWLEAGDSQLLTLLGRSSLQADDLAAHVRAHPLGFETVNVARTIIEAEQVLSQANPDHATLAILAYVDVAPETLLDAMLHHEALHIVRLSEQPIHALAETVLELPDVD